MAIMKRFLMFCSVGLLAGLYYLLASLNVLQFIRAIPKEQYSGLNLFLIGLTKPLALTVISIIAYLVGLFLVSSKAKLWSERIILICALVAILPFVLPFFMSATTDADNGISKGLLYYQGRDTPRIPAASPQSNLDALVSLANDGDVDSIMTVAHLYCVGCDTAVKVDTRGSSPKSRNATPEDLSKYQRPDEDIKEALKWYETAARMGSLKAKNIAGEILVHGVGVLQDMKKAFQLFNDAAKQGYVPAQFNLAAMYEYGYGVDKDILQAHMWYNIIAAGAKSSSDEDALYARTLRSALEPKMGTVTIAQASENAKNCLESKFQNCR
jgi:hypothetical protein